MEDLIQEGNLGAPPAAAPLRRAPVAAPAAPARPPRARPLSPTPRPAAALPQV